MKQKTERKSTKCNNFRNEQIFGISTNAERTRMFGTQGMMCQCKRKQEEWDQRMWYQNKESVVLGTQELGTVVLGTQEPWCSVPRKRGARYPGTMVLGTQEPGTVVLGT